MTCRDNEIKEKIQRCVKQGHIDPEDFKGVSIFAFHASYYAPMI